MITIYFLKGSPASGKSTWAKSKIAEAPNDFVRINNDEIRAMTNGSVYSYDYEQLISATRSFMIREALKRGKNLIIDNVNANNRHWKETCEIAVSMNKDIEVVEMPFYCSLEELLTRDGKRDGVARVGEDVVKQWFGKLGGEKFAEYVPRKEVFRKRDKAVDKEWSPAVQDDKLPRAVIFDNDGTLSIIHPNRSPYDASTADQDIPHAHVIECMRLYFEAGYKILFVSGREEKDREPTERFYKKHFPEVKYELYMRPTGNKEKDVLIKERIYNEHIKGKYFVAGWYDDRLQVAKWVYGSGLPLFRVNDPEAIF